MSNKLSIWIGIISSVVTIALTVLNYNLNKGWYLITDMIITSNWKADQSWTVPLGGGAGKMFKIGSQNINTRIEFY